MPERVTIKDVAARAGVSYQTVSKVLNKQARVTPATEARIANAVKALRYVPDQRARNLRAQRSHLIGYSWRPEPPDRANPILDLFLQSMMATAQQTGYHLLPFPFPTEEGHIPAYRDLIQTGRVDGFILSGMEYHDPRIKFLQAEEFPFVAFGRSHTSSNFPYVDVDGAEGLRLATRHLLEQGHERIAALAWPKSSRVGQDRLEGYVSAMREAGIAPKPNWLARGQGSVTFGHVSTLRWLNLAPAVRPTAIVAFSDAMAIGAMRAIHEHGFRVGADIAVTGFDDSPMSQYLTPPLTTLRQPVWQVGEKVIDILVGLLNDRPPSQTQILLPPQLIVRQSSLRQP